MARGNSSKRKLNAGTEGKSKERSPSPSEKSAKKRKTRSNATPEGKNKASKANKAKKNGKEKTTGAISGDRDKEPTPIPDEKGDSDEDDLGNGPEQDDEGEKFELHPQDMGDFDTSLTEEQSQSTSDLSGVNAIEEESDEGEIEDDEEQIERIVNEEMSDSESESEREVMVKKKTSPKRTPKNKDGTKRKSSLKKKDHPEKSASEGRNDITEKERKQLQEISEFFKQKDALSKAWEWMNEMKKHQEAESADQVTRTEADVETIKSSENSNANAEVLPSTSTGKGAKPKGRKQLPPLSKETNHKGNREGIDVSRLYRVPTLSRSEITIYSTNHGANPVTTSADSLELLQVSENTSTSPMNVSDESNKSGTTFSSEFSPNDLNSSDEIPDFITETLRRASLNDISRDNTRERSDGDNRRAASQHREKTGEEKRRAVKRQTDQRITQADRSRTEAVKPEGKALEILGSLGGEFKQIACDLRTLLADNEFDPLAAQIDAATYECMESGKYVDLRKILPTESFFSDEDDECKYQISDDRDGKPTFVKAKAETEKQGINSIKRWLTAINVYASAYVKKNPHRSTEIFQYILDIQEAANTHTWESVYIYDRIFRRLMEKIPTRRWSTPYNKYYNKVLKPKTMGQSFSGNKKASDGSRVKKEICWKFNKGKCNRGDSCFRDHRCAFCGKYGHGEHVCRHKRDKKEKEQNKTGGARH